MRVALIKPSWEYPITSKEHTNNRCWPPLELLNCGAILDGSCSLVQMGQTIFETIVATASGTPTKSENYEFGGSEFVPWPMGAVL